MNRLFRTFFIFLLLLSTRSSFATSYDSQAEIKESRSNFAFKQSFSKNLDGLIAISTTSSSTVRQTSSDIDRLYCQANAAQIELSQLLASLNGAEYCELVLPAIKSYQRAAQKVATKFGGDASQITDLARASLVADDIYSLMIAYEDLSQKAKIVQVKNRFAVPKASGYRDLNLLVKLPQTQMIVEVQLHLKAISEIKNGEEHQVYETVQAIEASAKKQGRQLNDIEVAKITQLRQQSHKLYHKAWLNYKRLDNASLIAA
ncbi:RelA/SpoT domain-containing protein [Shewanella psychrotolerans]|uniref:RelA/SpoT domain-containing protein n=1 Tax=Shewanella psychrotolerans TaxID=2864206 RepID=UPI001C65598E|nr:RelA/SpoT domain-containing protein [Shewanella psychrotolerans]QYK02274.1 RelA/SpoT domain-containing protein [Shewanella psychrotolerans]